MKQIEVEYEVGSSSAAVSKRSLFTAILFENKSAQRQNTNWLTGNTKRKYKRKRRVWVCGDGCGSVAADKRMVEKIENANPFGRGVWGKIFAVFLQLAFMVMFFIALLLIIV
jgi:hypothetical protein